jgi:hypothetical protein
MYVPFSFYSRSDPAQSLQPTPLPRRTLTPQCRGPSCAIVKVLQSFGESRMPSTGFSAKFLSKSTVFWDVMSCRLVDFYRRLGQTYWHHRRISPARSLVYPDDRGTAFLRNVGKCQPEYTASHPKKQLPL